MKFDLIVVLFAMASIALFILFIVGLDMSLPPLDMTQNPDGSITYTGISTLITSACSGIAAIISAWKRE